MAPQMWILGECIGHCFNRLLGLFLFRKHNLTCCSNWMVHWSEKNEKSSLALCISLHQFNLFLLLIFQTTRQYRGCCVHTQLNFLQHLFIVSSNICSSSHLSNNKFQSSKAFNSSSSSSLLFKNFINSSDSFLGHFLCGESDTILHLVYFLSKLCKVLIVVMISSSSRRYCIISNE